MVLLGVDEAKALFRQSYERGKLYATRTSYYDTFWLILAGRSDDSMLELLLRWGFHVLSNFTAGMIGAVWNYAWALPALIRSFAASWWSGVAFFLVAVVSAASVAASLLLLLFGTAGGVTYGVVAAAPHSRDWRRRGIRESDSVCSSEIGRDPAPPTASTDRPTAEELGRGAETRDIESRRTRRWREGREGRVIRDGNAPREASAGA